MKNLKLYIMFALYVLVLSACKKQLNEPPPNAKVNGTAVVDLKSAQVTLNGVYYQFAGATPTLYNWAVQNVQPGMLTGMLGYGQTAAGSYQEEFNNNVNAGFQSPWGRWYRTIAAANGFLDGLKALAPGIINPVRSAEMEAEARFLRAYTNFKLLHQFAEWKDLDSKNGVLLHKELTGISAVVKPRNTVAESYAFILEDLDFAAANGPTMNPNYYMNKYAAMILQARVLLNRGQPADISKALNLSNLVISSGKYTLENNVKDIFYSKGLASAEVILGVKPQPLQETKRETNSGGYNFPTGAFSSAVYTATQAFKARLNGDPRQTWMVGPDGSAGVKLIFTKFLPLATPTTTTPPTQLSETSIAMRLSEAYLLKAEAIARTPGGDLTDAKAQIKTVMARAGATNFAAVDAAATPLDVWKQVYFETLRGFTGEDGIDWFALGRFPFDTIKELRPTITTITQLWFGVPVSEFAVNPLFGAQNAGGYPIQ